MNIITTYRSDVPIPATHRAHMHRNEPDLVFPALCGEDLCRVSYWRELQRSALAFDIPEDSEDDLPRFPIANSLDSVTVFDVEAIPFALEASCSTRSLSVVPRDLVDISHGLLPAVATYAELPLDDFLVWEERIRQVLAHVEHEVSNELWGLDISLQTHSRRPRRSLDSALMRSVCLDVARTADRLLKGGQ